MEVGMTQWQVRTQAVRQGIESDEQYGAVVPPIYLTSNYGFVDHTQAREFDYSRSGNPTRQTLASALTALEHGKGAVITNSGMSAILLVLHFLKADDLLIVPHDCYGGCLRLFTHLAEKGQFRLLVVDQTDPQALNQALAENAAMIWLETPSNPLLRLVDIASICNKAKQHDTTVVVDNTFLSPILQQPLLLGADIVVHSTTKYINGHSDIIGGAVIAKTEELVEQLDWWSNTLGVTAGAFDSYLALRSVRTLAIRMQAHQENAQKIVALLADNEQVEQVYYPGLPSHPNHELACQQQQGFGAMVSFELKGGSEAVALFLSELTLFSLAESLGGVESLVAVPATMTHRAMTPDARQRAGIKDTLIRLSVGLEAADDLVADLAAGLARVSELLCDN